MELVSKKILIILCGLCLTAAVAEGYLLFRTKSAPTRYHSLDYQTQPFAFVQRHFAPWDMMPFGMFPKNFMNDWDDDSFFKNKFQNGKFLEESFIMSGPTRDDKGEKVNLTFDIKGHEKGNFDVKVSKHQITLTGKDDQSSNQVSAEPKNKHGFWFWKKNETKGETPDVQTKSETHWSMTQSFPLPSDVDSTNYSVERAGDKLTVVFNKVKANSSSNIEPENL